MKSAQRLISLNSEKDVLAKRIDIIYHVYNIQAALVKRLAPS